MLGSGGRSIETREQRALSNWDWRQGSVAAFPLHLHRSHWLPVCVGGPVAIPEKTYTTVGTREWWCSCEYLFDVRVVCVKVWRRTALRCLLIRCPAAMWLRCVRGAQMSGPERLSKRCAKLASSHVLQHCLVVRELAVQLVLRVCCRHVRQQDHSRRCQDNRVTRDWCTHAVRKKEWGTFDMRPRAT